MHKRPVRVDDAKDIAALIEACDVAILGRSDYTLTEIEADLRRDDLEHTGWYDEQGALVAYGWVGRVADSSKVELDAYVQPGADDNLGPRLLADLESRGLELVAEAGQDHAVFDLGVYREDERTAGWLRSRGFEVGTTFTRMGIDLPPPPDLSAADPAIPLDLSAADPAIATRAADKSEGELRIAHALHEEAMGAHYGHVPQTFDAFRDRLEREGPDWSQVWLAELDGRPVGLLVGTRQFEEDDDAGYVRTLAVVPAGRGRGVAKRLLRTYFAAAQEEGRERVLLHVDQANVTNALALYESVGMRPVLQIDAWAKRSPVLPT